MPWWLDGSPNMWRITFTPPDLSPAQAGEGFIRVDGARLGAKLNTWSRIVANMVSCSRDHPQPIRGQTLTPPQGLWDKKIRRWQSVAEISVQFSNRKPPIMWHPHFCLRSIFRSRPLLSREGPHIKLLLNYSPFINLTLTFKSCHSHIK